MSETSRSRRGSESERGDSNPYFSIVTICFNDIEGLQATSRSLTPQTFKDYEWLVIDGGSEDGTVEWLRSHKSEALSWTSKPDEGLYDAMNQGLDQAVGDYVVFMNSGDLFADTAVLEAVYESLRGDSVDLLYGDAIEFDEAGEYYKPARNHRWVSYSMFTHHQAMFYRRDALQGHRYDCSYQLFADWVLTANLLKGGASARYVARPLCRFLRGGLSMVGEKRDVAEQELRRMHREVLDGSLVTRFLLANSKRLANAFRSHFPKAYERIRMRR